MMPSYEQSFHGVWYPPVEAVGLEPAPLPVWFTVALGAATSLFAGFCLLVG